jgi:hypothetical protein
LSYDIRNTKWNSLLEAQTLQRKEVFMKKTAYLIRATKRFLEGTNCKSPIQAVEQGIKTLGDWIDTLSLEQEIEATQIEFRRIQHKATKNYHST